MRAHTDSLPYVSELRVLLDGTPVGTLINGPAGYIYFAYDAAWVAHGFPLSPIPAFGLQLQPFHAANNLFGGLHGVFNDALPDGWGLLLMDRELKQTIGWDPHEIRPLDRLSYIGDRAMGALEFEPVLEEIGDEKALSIAALAEAAMAIEEGSTGDVIESMYLQGGSPGGARPKITIAISADGQHCRSGFRDTPAGYDHWIVKFRARATDPHCVGRIEMAYADMARAAGITMPDTKLITVTARGQQQDYFAVKRFDRDGNKKKHALSIGGMLEASHRLPSIDYDALLTAIGFATQDAREIEKAFRLMVFNVLAHNKDDHVKNFSILWNGSGWVMTPAYDLTFSSSQHNQHMTAVNGSGNPALKDIHAIAKNHSIKTSKKIINEVISAVKMWPQYAAQWGVDPDQINVYQGAMLKMPCRLELDQQT